MGESVGACNYPTLFCNNESIMTDVYPSNPDRFQMVSLLKLAKVTEEGVRFLSPHDGTPM